MDEAEDTEAAKAPTRAERIRAEKEARIEKMRTCPHDGETYTENFGLGTQWYCATCNGRIPDRA